MCHKIMFDRLRVLIYTSQLYEYIMITKLLGYKYDFFEKKAPSVAVLRISNHKVNHRILNSKDIAKILNKLLEQKTISVH